MPAPTILRARVLKVVSELQQLQRDLGYVGSHPIARTPQAAALVNDSNCSVQDWSNGTPLSVINPTPGSTSSLIKYSGIFAQANADANETISAEPMKVGRKRENSGSNSDEDARLGDTRFRDESRSGFSLHDVRFRDAKIHEERLYDTAIHQQVANYYIKEIQ